MLDIAKIARTHIDRITGILENPANAREREAFAAFAIELRDDLNYSITDGDIIEMLAQHLITKPVFDALFEGYSFAQHNPMSQAMQGVLDLLQEHHLNKEADTLQSFYDRVKERARGIENAAGKQKIVVELYDKFFRNAFPRMTERLGIVYTPVEVVDFIIHSVGHILHTEFGETLGSKGVHIIDPFTGTGTFITRLLQSGLITPEQLPYKYQHEIHANEIVLLAYYIAAINIEATYHGIVGGDYRPFEGICLTDTFQLYEKEDLVDALLVNNSARRKRQKKLDIRVIVGNPPYSAGQDNQNDDNQNVVYPLLDTRIASTYVSRSSRQMGKSKAYDSYIRAIRWASDRIGNSGVVGFVTNAGFLESNSADGLRKCLAEEFSNIFVFHLRGNQRTSGDLSRKEGGKIFGSGSRAPIAISLLVKNPSAAHQGQIRFYDIGDYLTTEEKLEKIGSLASIEGITQATHWQRIEPNQHGDWLKQRNDTTEPFISIGSKVDKDKDLLFSSYSMGLKTNRDAWVYQFSKTGLIKTLERTVAFYNSEVVRLSDLSEQDTERFLDRDKSKIKWTTDLQTELLQKKKHNVRREDLVVSLYRPFTKMWVYANSSWNWTRHLMPKYFPATSPDNRVICVTGVGAGKEFSVLMSNLITEVHTVSTAQCFPLWLYHEQGAETDSAHPKTGGLFAAIPPTNAEKRRNYAITDHGLAHFQSAFSHEKIAKEDLFYYVYGLLHSPEFRERYADNLSKELPRIPRVNSAADFWSFSQAGRELGELHLNYESVEKYPLQMTGGELLLTDADYRVEKMRYGKNGKDKDLTTLIYNDKITLTGIPLEAYAYVVNGKPALDWVVERQCVKTDKDSGIVNDANDWAIETMNNPRYPLELFQRVITVSLKTMDIVRSLPELGELNS